MPLLNKLLKYSNTEWFHGEDKYNAKKNDKFFSASEDVADNFGKVRKIEASEFPSSPLIIPSKEVFAEEVAYKGDPMIEPMYPKIPKGQSFDELAKAYAQKRGYDGIIYEEGTFGEAELHYFQ
jgi:hypothetical protein